MLILQILLFRSIILLCSLSSIAVGYSLRTSSVSGVQWFRITYSTVLIENSWDQHQQQQQQELGDMASLAIAATRSLMGHGSTRTASTLPKNFSSCSAGGLVQFGKVMMNYAAGRGPQRCNFSACRAATSASSSHRSFGVVAAKPSSTIQVGDKLLDAELAYLDKNDQVQTIKVSELTDGKKVVLFAVPAAFSPTCSSKQMPAFVDKADEFMARGIDTIACVSVNDVFVQKAWAENLGVGDKVLLLSDGNCNFTKALGLELDMSGMGMGVRSRRYSLLAENGVVKQLNLEEGGGYTISGPEEILKVLP